jgi:mannan endo-1,4-beta-mannosidase
MAENDSIPTLENFQLEKAGWLYFLPWYDGGTDSTNFLSNSMFNTVEDLTEMYQSDYCITLDELPYDLYTSEGGGCVLTTTTTTEEVSVTTTESVTTTTATEVTTAPAETTIDASDTESSETVSAETTTTTTTETTTTTTESTPSEATLYGDINLDGKVSIMDVIYLNKYMANAIQLNAEALGNADCASGSGINSADATALLQYIVQLVKVLPVQVDA